MKQVRFEDMILFEDQDYIVINKPPFIATLEDRTPHSTNILKLARAYDPEAQVAHRLDKETSGALAIARNAEAYRHLAMQFEAREVTKLYHAVVWGLHNYEGIAVDRNLFTTGKGTVKISPDGKPALTYFRTLATYRQHSLLECKPITGRMHQIRVHLGYIQAPIVGDELYGGKNIFRSELKRKFNLKKLTEEQPLIKRFALHAAELSFTLPGGQPVQNKSTLP